MTSHSDKTVAKVFEVGIGSILAIAILGFIYFVVKTLVGSEILFDPLSKSEKRKKYIKGFIGWGLFTAAQTILVNESPNTFCQGNPTAAFVVEFLVGGAVMFIAIHNGLETSENIRKKKELEKRLSELGHKRNY